MSNTTPQKPSGSSTTTPLGGKPTHSIEPNKLGNPPPPKR
jgi:hypothetical protein